MTARLRVINDADLGVIGAVVDEAGQIVATASSHFADGVYVAIDEARVFEATGRLLPLPADVQGPDE